ncbi:MAG TPA: phospho-N-acetylmuramoyl-pentapeptide-transferase [Candidatus Woesebacteria bacterium]|nr:phospho-N-acetylmuramoyl-pentapeptide-transferase [Candidatus Woesebacteria bacterium]HNS94567.1 phospho-N-acetylmuramoyl-pentapeptide-transferase [Candidatus Woesebacteria bacterium]
MNPDSLFLFGTILSFLVHFACFIPFINFLYRRKMQRAEQTTKDPFGTTTPIFDQMNKHKVGTPVGGGILVIALTSVLFFVYMGWFLLTKRFVSINYPSLLTEVVVLLFTFVSFGLLGLYDDLSKIFLWKRSNYFGMRWRQKLIIELVLAAAVALTLFLNLKIDIIHIPFVGAFELSYWYVFFAMFVIVAFSNAVNITDGLDGLSTGVMLIALTGFWIVSRSIIDVPTSIFISVWLGGILAFLYFNIYPARIMLGDTGALSFGATFAVIGLILGKPFALPVIGGVFVLEAASSAFQLLSKRFAHKRLFAVSPFHLYLQHRGWPEPKVVFRLWILGVIFVLMGLAIAFI